MTWYEEKPVHDVFYGQIKSHPETTIWVQCIKFVRYLCFAAQIRFCCESY